MFATLRFGISSYENYLTTKHWLNLRHKHIEASKDAACWICGNRYGLNLHHTSYQNLGRETFNDDLIILCYSCHQKVHFIFFGLIKLPLKRRIVIARMNYLKLINSIQNGKPIASLYYGLRCMLCI